ncbi:MAG: SixA phosphatase family protein, partial [Vicinamibacterales bacterium]
MKTLLSLRHAKSSWSDATVDDRDRDLNARGRRDAVRMGELIRQNQLSPDVIISSDALRARLTAEAVADVIGFQEEIALDRRLYLASPADIVAVIRTAAGAATTVMIVGHNPGLEQLVERLTGEPNDLP